MLQDFRCGKCNRLLARIGEFSQIQIKCSRCAALNHMKTERLQPSPQSESSSAPVRASSIRS
ncbi:Com family DNA-binding transcriptional regulator [Pseudomonas fuscovaginae UPB0736]|uniref:Mu-like prophage FluMu protein Com n=1 Tax=Pseudomonas asplenii TaxID=53407 RepID=A0A1H6NPQ3_9PSED|nr:MULTISPECIES: Com family DNA-binding transcriptional regulator [Pseudomonas]UUQ66352.1 Com family DNA-binding transcriptional regulator [Pseudomonas fuscovaginae UPB0736]UZE30424.1 Com family DNA-binding transcriptional regulator [Pseudomonas asplenii]SDR97780.1 Mu-like prophage FluMu protein Com [Pseudomonas asplenii]SEI12585.1 Mu-like prophage FluMu protein Com [Pseudomonas fuscovaginae]